VISRDVPKEFSSQKKTPGDRAISRTHDPLAVFLRGEGAAGERANRHFRPIVRPTVACRGQQSVQRRLLNQIIR
jgi:hypothetical protein